MFTSRFVVGLTTFLMALALTGCATSPALNPGAASVPGQLSKYCPIDGNPLPAERNSELIGIYDGTWDQKLEQTVIIHEIDGKEVKTFYAHGKYAPWDIHRPNCGEAPGELKNDRTIVLNRFRNGAKVKYVLMEDGETLQGEYKRDGRTTYGNFKRVM